SRRHTDPARSAPGQRYHTHDRIEPAQPGRIYRVDVELWPTSPRSRLPTGARFRARPAAVFSPPCAEDRDADADRADQSFVRVNNGQSADRDHHAISGG